MSEFILHAGERTDTRVTRSSFKGIERVDIRLYADVNGERRPTRKGVSIPIERVPDLITALQALSARVGSEIESEG